MYEDGDGVKKNLAEAAKWYKKAAEQGDVDAQFNLGNLYSREDVGIKNYKEARKWYKMAVKQGSQEAKHNLKIMDNIFARLIRFLDRFDERIDKW